MLLEAIKRSQLLHALDPFEEIDNFPGGGVGIGGGDSNSGQSGISSGFIVPTLSLSPNRDTSVAVGTTLCLEASGAISLPMEIETIAKFNTVSPNAQYDSTGHWQKTSSTVNIYDAETFDSNLIYKLQPFHITGRNTHFATPGPPNNNLSVILGVKSINGYQFFWEVFKYCNATAGSCSSNWLAYPRVKYPNGSIVTLGGGIVEANQQFRVKGDGTRIIWEYTTHNNWAYNYTSTTIPSDCGNLQFFVNGLYKNNCWSDLRTYKGSYQGTISSSDYNWTTNCSDNLVITGSKACYTPTVPGSCQICVSTVNVAPICRTIVSSPLYFKPIDSPCNSCGTPSDCENIPNPTTPIIIAEQIDTDSISVTWNDSNTFTTGLYYVISVNGIESNLIDSTTILDSLPTGTYTIKVKAIDVCGESPWSNEVIVVLTGSTGSLTAPANFSVGITSYDPTPAFPIYTATWDSVPGAVLYEIWVGNPQRAVFTSTTLTSEELGHLNTHITVYLSIRAKDSLGNYSPFSSIISVP